MTPREVIYQLLDQVLLETRLEGERTANALFFQVADLLEHTPIDLARALQGNGACEDILVQLRDRARQRGYGWWLDRATGDYRRRQEQLASAGLPAVAHPARDPMIARNVSTLSSRWRCSTSAWRRTSGRTRGSGAWPISSTMSPLSLRGLPTASGMTTSSWLGCGAMRGAWATGRGSSERSQARWSLPPVATADRGRGGAGSRGACRR